MIPLIAAGIGALGSVAGSAIGSAAGGGDRERQSRLLKQILEQYGTIDVPTLERIQAEQLGPSAMEGVQGQMDPRLRGEQMDSMDRLSQISKTGDDATSKAMMNRILADVARQEASGRHQIENSMRARGTSGSGAELAMALSNQQGAADRAQTAGLDQAAQAQQRMLQAILQKGQMAGQVRGQDYSMASDAARARDMINQYNAQGREKAKYYNAGLPAQQFGMQMQKAGGMAGALGTNANAAGQSAQSAAQTGYGIGNAIGQAGAMVGSEFARKQEREEDRADREKYGVWGWGGGGNS